MIVVATAVWFAYEVPGIANSGQTLGKRLLRHQGGPAGERRAARLRPVVAPLEPAGPADAALGLLRRRASSCSLDCLFVAIDRPLRQALHDKAAATVVVQVPRPDRPRPPTPVPENADHRRTHDADPR